MRNAFGLQPCLINKRVVISCPGRGSTFANFPQEGLTMSQLEKTKPRDEKKDHVRIDVEITCVCKARNEIHISKDRKERNAKNEMEKF